MLDAGDAVARQRRQAERADPAAQHARPPRLRDRTQRIDIERAVVVHRMPQCGYIIQLKQVDRLVGSSGKRKNHVPREGESKKPANTEEAAFVRELFGG